MREFVLSWWTCSWCWYFSTEYCTGLGTKPVGYSSKISTRTGTNVIAGLATGIISFRSVFAFPLDSYMLQVLWVALAASAMMATTVSKRQSLDLSDNAVK
jgi:Na+/H+-translocating membrane pyrophosphatase